MTHDEEKYFITAVLVVFTVFGSAGNAVVLYVFSTSKDDLVSTLFIIVLAVVDFITCLIIIPFTIVVELVAYRVRFDLLCKIYQFLITSNIPFSALIMTAIAVDRYFCICHPFSRLLTLRRARIVVLVLATFASLLGIVAALTHGVYQRDRVVANATEHGAVTQSTVTLPVSRGNQSKVFHDETVYTGFCEPNELILSTPFASAFQKCYTAVFVVCLGVVVVLYSVIYRSVLRQRHKRQEMKAVSVRSYTSGGQCTAPTFTQEPPIAVRGRSGSASSASAQRDNQTEDAVCVEAAPEAVEMVAVIESPANDRPAGEKCSHAAGPTVDAGVTAAAAAAAQTARSNRIANIKTAAMLFVVTLVFTVSFLPSLAMTVHLLPYNMTIFYVYFANNVANPIIYSFMNSNFRKRLVLLFCNRNARRS